MFESTHYKKEYNKNQIELAKQAHLNNELLK